MEQLAHLALDELVDGDARPLRHDVGDVLGIDLFLQHPVALLQFVEVGGGVGDPALDLGDAPVADFGSGGEIGLALHLRAKVFEFLLEDADRADRLLLRFPMPTHLGGVRLQRGEVLVERGEPFLRRRVGLLFQRDVLDLELADAAFDDIDLGGHRVDLDAQLRRRFVHEVDGLVGQEAIGEVAVREDRRADERRILDAHAVVHLVALLQPAQDGDGVLHRRLADVHLLEAAFERRILLDVLAVLVERRRPDHPQFTAGEHRFDHVAGIHRPFGRASTDDRVQFVDEGDDLALGVGDLLEHGLEPFLELAAVLRPGDHRADVEGDEALVLQAFGYVAVGDAPGEAFDDGGLTDARLADEDRVVLRAAREHLDGATDLLVTTDDRIDLAVVGAGRQVLAVLLERLELLLGVLRRDPVAAADGGERPEQLLAAHPERAAARTFGEGEQQVLDRQEVVLQLLARRLGGREHVVEGAAEAQLAAIGMGQLRHGFVGAVAEHEWCEAEPLQHGQHDRAVLAQDGGEQVVGRDLGVGVGLRQCLGGRDRLLRLLRPLLRVEHSGPSLLASRRARQDAPQEKLSAIV